MSQTPFAVPLYLKLHSAENFEARTPHEALRYLDLYWSAARTAHYRQARAVCQSAIDNLVAPEVARKAVEDAARRADLLAERWEADGRRVNTVHVPLADEPQDGEVSDSDFVTYFRAKDIVDDAALAPSRKKALLAYWASDRHAVAGAPGLRCIRGVTVTIDSLFDAMAQIDTEIDPAAMAMRRDRNPEASW